MFNMVAHANAVPSLRAIRVWCLHAGLRPAIDFPAVRTSLLLTIGFCLCLPWLARADPGYEIGKVNHELIDKEGHTHAEIADLVAKARYQGELADSGKAIGIRFIVHWKAPSTLMSDLVVKVEARGLDAGTQAEVVETLLKTYDKVPGPNGWAFLDLQNEAYKRLGKLMAWKVTLLHDNQPMASRKSFTWDDSSLAVTKPTATVPKP